MAKQSRVFSVRLHPSDPKEKQAIEIIDALMDNQYTMRQIVTDAILHRDGASPEMFKDNGNALTLSAMEDLLTDFAAHIIREMMLKNIAVQDNLPLESGSTQEHDDEMASNMAAAYMSRRRR